jgi:hypothetical protein
MRKKEVSEYIDSFGTLERVVVKDGVEITMSDEALEAIAKKARWVHESGFSTIEKLETGLMGQAADAYEVKNNWREGVEQMTQEPDKYDMLYRGYMIDDKTFDIRDYIRRGIKPHSLMAVRLKQFHDAERRYLFYIGNLRLSGDKIRIIGFMTRRALENLEREGSTAIYEGGDPNYENVVVKRSDQFTQIKDLDAAIDRMLD